METERPSSGRTHGGLPNEDVMAVLADLQAQVDALARAVAGQQEVLDRLLADRARTSDG